MKRKLDLTKATEKCKTYFQHNKVDFVLLPILLFFLISSRVLTYYLWGFGDAVPDSTDRYIPQALRIGESFWFYFSSPGLNYPLILYIFKMFFNEMIIGPVFLQHILGIATALLTFLYFKKLNVYLSFFVSLVVFTSQRALVVEHYVLRDSYVAFIFVVLMILMFPISSKTLASCRPLRRGALVGVTALTLFWFRVEYLGTIVAMLVLFLVRVKIDKIGFNYKKFVFGIFVPFFLFASLRFFAPTETSSNPYGYRFGIAFLGLTPQVFNYEGSKHPDLIHEFQMILKGNKKIILADKEALPLDPENCKLPTQSQRTIQKIQCIVLKFGFAGSAQSLATGIEDLKYYVMGGYETIESSIPALLAAADSYIKKKGLNMNYGTLLDDIYPELITKNPKEFFISYLKNLKCSFIGNEGIYNLVSTVKLPIMVLILVFPTYFFNQYLTNQFIFHLLLLVLPIAVYRAKSIPRSLLSGFLILTFHLMMLVFVAPAIFRYRYPFDTILYFLPLYIILPNRWRMASEDL